jgi:hypothetical protein
MGNGDFNYDGKVNILDYAAIDSNIGNQSALLHLNAATNPIAVPEPAGLGLLAFAMPA